MKRWAAMLRGVNLGGRKLIMTDLARICSDLGYTDVKTLLASGNVVFTAKGSASAIEKQLEEALAKHGLDTDVLVRDKDELAEVIATDPWPKASADHPSHYLVTFHRDPFPADALKRLAEVHDGPEKIHAAGRETYTDYLSQQGMRDSKLVQGMKKAKFPKVATGRNWNTVGKLHDML